MTDLDREQLKRACADALEVLHRTQSVEGLAVVANSLRALGPPYRFHGELMHGALRDGNQNAITWHLIHVLEKAREGRDVEVRRPRGAQTPAGAVADQPSPEKEE